MNRRLLAATGAVTTFGLMLPSVFGSQSGKKAKAPTQTRKAVSQAPASAIYTTPGSPTIRHLEGDVSLTKAVEIALRQNPDILRQIQEIQRTRGQIIEVRAQALPQITLTGVYNQQDPRLIGSGRNLTGGNSSLTSTSSQIATQTTPVTELTTAKAAVPGSNIATAQQTASQVDVQDLISALGKLNSQTSKNAAQQIQNKSWNISIQATQLIYSGGQVKAALKIAKFSQDSAYFQLRDTIDRIISTVRTQFYLVLLDRALITVQEESVKLLEEQLQDQKNRFEAGTVPRFNVLQAEVALSNARPDLIRAKNNSMIAQIQFARTLGLDPGPKGIPMFHCVGELTMSDRKIDLPDALQLARARRPFLKVQRQSILIDVESVKVELAGYKPSLSVQGGYELRNQSASEDLGDTVNGYFFGVNGSWNIFDGFATYGRVKEARARLEQSKVNYDDSVHQVDVEVQTAYANFRQAQETNLSQLKNVEEALEAVRLARERLDAGAGTQLDVLNAQVSLTKARSTELQSRADFDTAIAEFDRATATDTVYNELFKDPLAPVQKGIFARLAETGLPKLPTEKSGK